MISAIIYRYPHPFIHGKWLYVGQDLSGKKRRDRIHRTGKSSFGRRFLSKFPGVELPSPVYRQISVFNQLELNEEEIVDIFRYGCWHGQGGMNLVIPGSLDYRRMGCLTVILGVGIHGRSQKQKIEDARKGGLIGGKKNVSSGQILSPDMHTYEIASAGGRIGGLIAGRLSVENGRLASYRTKEHQSVAGRIGGLIGGHIQGLRNAASGHLKNASHIRWHVNRNITKLDCQFCIIPEKLTAEQEAELPEEFQLPDSDNGTEDN